MKELTLYLDDLTPGQLSMKRLAEYLRELSTLYGHESEVHFDSVKEGSAQLQSLIEEQAYNGILQQVREVSGGLGSKRVLNSYEKLSELMAHDKTRGSLRSGGAKIFQFPVAKNEPPPLRVVKPSSVQGKLYSVGGKDDTVPVRIEGGNGETLMCEAGIDIAERLAQILFKTVRVHGDGEWEKRADGCWKLIKLKVTSFEKLEDIGFKEAIARLKAAGGVNWNDIPNAHSEILDTRG
ncbi:MULTISPECIES: hypothetical protein [unclassified Pseudomonas]|uniref:hypothetical protein n=1 Tax=unclassified Pseudomonas TaxID=196821 RepID=UPI002409DB78|nr:hypothetical protein [Pseudomonas sp. NyZ480]WEZ90424.1 hypothetical protein P3R38_09225 [Pseudomonas sp. NyZ480]